ncbi:DUF6221 family protein [Actinomadura rugatobispora]|uniref:DUF6221 family protein n=1 Tax=Actinomadura rugatobispora TaxID=1994 RepID=A0ABW1A577_9ACTN|nr:hypothetical protein GCM10010200_003020 [Actinomadura rugatobispora]
MDLVEFLRARLAKDEQIARACSGASWTASPSGTVHLDPAGGGEPSGSGFVASVENGAYAEFIARYDPDRALQEVAARRRIVDDYEKGAWVLEQGQRTEAAEAAHAARLAVLRLLALPYAHHPEYRQEWRP